MRVIEVVIDVCALQCYQYALADMFIGLQVVRRPNGYIWMVREAMRMKIDEC
jgi:hypothetical protein